MTKALPAGPKGEIMLGHLNRLKAHWGNALAADVAQFGDVIPYRLGPSPYLFVNDPALIEEFFFKHNKALGRADAHRIARPLQGNGMFVNDNYESWLSRRRMIAPSFHKSALARYVSIIVEVSDQVFGALKAGTVDIRPHALRLSLRVVCRALFGSEPSEGGELEASLSALLAAFSERVGAPIPLPDWMPLPSNLRMRRAVAGFDKIVARFMEEHRGKDMGDFLSLLMNARDESGNGLTDAQVRDEAVSLLFAGYETTATTIAAAFHYLATLPMVQDKLRAEVQAFGQRAPTFADLASLRYTNAFVNEVMRLAPPAWGSVRQAKEDVELGGYPVKKGWHVMVSQWVMHRDKRYWRDPERFDPERWLDGSTDALPKCAYFPFGQGGRMCLGAEFARIELAVALVRLGQMLHLGSTESSKLDLDLGWTVRPRSAVEVTLRHVTSDVGHSSIRKSRATKL